MPGTLALVGPGLWQAVEARDGEGRPKPGAQHALAEGLRAAGLEVLATDPVDALGDLQWRAERPRRRGAGSGEEAEGDDGEAGGGWLAVEVLAEAGDGDGDDAP